jgi:hypothetical protein
MEKEHARRRVLGRRSSSEYQRELHCNENPIYVLPEKELRGLSPNYNTHVSVSE